MVIPNMLKGDVLGGLWVVDKLIGEGACAKVYTVTNKKNSDGIEYVAKVIPHAKGKSKKNKDQERLCNTLNYEYMLYTGLLINFDLKPSVPAKFYGDDMVNGVRYLIMEKLDMDLTHYATSFSPLSLSKVAEFGLQILDGLEWFHRNFFIFVDVKPDNFMVKGDKLYFVDYGLVERWVAHNGGAKADTGKPAAGTPTFWSLAVHNGSDAGRKDDVESMGLVLLSLATEGKLPWSLAQSDEECRRTKESCDILKYARELGCEELGEIVMCCRSLNCQQTPDYTMIRRLLQSLKDKKGTMPTKR